jgi:hypothetical protein
MIGGMLFDGWSLEWLNKKGILALGKAYESGRNYLLVGFEATPAMKEKRKRQLLSYNNATASQMIFSSFGDANGCRKDIYALLRLKEKNQLEHEAFDGVREIFEHWNHKKSHEIIHHSEHLILKAYLHDLSDKDIESSNKEAFDLMLHCGYLEKIESGKIICPVPIIMQSELESLERIYKDLFDEMIPLLIHELKEVQVEIEKLAAFTQGIPMEELFNELWHQIFSKMIEQLIEDGLFEKPVYCAGQGRYLKNIVMFE